MTARVPVTFEPADVTVWVEPDSTVLEASKLAGVVVAAPCGGRGICGSCGVRVVDGELAAPDDEERRGLTRAPAGVRLACRARVAGPARLRPLIAQSRPSVAAGASAGQRLVAGVDLGTTNVVVVLVDPASGRELVRASRPNAQQSYGADILSRVSAAIAGSERELTEAAWSSVRGALRTALDAVSARDGSLERVVIAGNSAMAALLAGADVTTLSAHPFSAPALPDTLDAEKLEGVLAAGAQVVLVPPIAGFVGGDALAGLVAGGLCDATAPTLLVDLGTNAEILLAGAGPLRVASAAAGPAFEGGGISCGGPAAPGAVERVRVGDDGAVELSVIGGGVAEWLSGSGLVSAIAELLRRGHLTAEGLMVREGPLEARFGTDARGVLEVTLDDAGRVRLNQLDVRALQLAKAAVQVGIERVLLSAGVGVEGVEELRVAGAFGGALEPEDLADLGVVPNELRMRVRRAGNASLEGAAVVALDPGMLECAREAAAGVIHVDLAADPGFEAALMTATSLRTA